MRVARELDGRQRNRCVASVVLSPDRQLEVDRRKLVPAHGPGRRVEPVLEEPLDLRAGRELAVVVEIDVRGYRDLGPKHRDRPVGLVAFDDEPAAPSPGIAAELGNLAADQKRGLVAEPVEAEGDHRGGRRLAVRTRNHDRSLQRDELGEKVGPRGALDLAAVRRRDDDFLPALGHDRLRRHLDRHPFERLQVWSLDPVPAADLRAPGSSEERVAGQPRPADPDEPDPAPVKPRQSPSAPRRSRRLRRGGPARTSRRASAPGARCRPAAPRRVPAPVRGRPR